MAAGESTAALPPADAEPAPAAFDLAQAKSANLKSLEGHRPDNKPDEDLRILQPAGSWSAIAYEDYSVSPGSTFGFSDGAGTREDAIGQAVRECERKSGWKESYFWYGCTVADRGVEGFEAVIEEGCISLYSNDNGVWRYAKGATEEDAAKKAYRGCVSANKQNILYPCKEVRSLCSAGTPQ